jgi:hypothetical protein
VSPHSRPGAPEACLSHETALALRNWKTKTMDAEVPGTLVQAMSRLKPKEETPLPTQVQVNAWLEEIEQV